MQITNKLEYGRVHADALQSRQDIVKAEKWTLVFKSWSENICPAGPERTETERHRWPLVWTEPAPTLGFKVWLCAEIIQLNIGYRNWSIALSHNFKCAHYTTSNKQIQMKNSAIAAVLSISSGQLLRSNCKLCVHHRWLKEEDVLAELSFGFSLQRQPSVPLKSEHKPTLLLGGRVMQGTDSGKAGELSQGCQGWQHGWRKQTHQVDAICYLYSTQNTRLNTA